MAWHILCCPSCLLHWLAEDIYVEHVFVVTAVDVGLDRVARELIEQVVVTPVDVGLDRLARELIEQAVGLGPRVVVVVAVARAIVFAGAEVRHAEVRHAKVRHAEVRHAEVQEGFCPPAAAPSA